MRTHMVMASALCAAALMVAASSGAQTSRAGDERPREQRSMLFVVTHTHGSARRPGTSSRIVGVARARSPEEAVKQFVDSTTEKWKFHADSRTDTYVRLENPISFISDRIDYYAAQAGKPVTNDHGRIRFTLSEIRHEDLFDERVVSTKRVWADSAAAALEHGVSQRDREGCTVSSHNRNRYTATLACPRRTGQTHTVSWRAVADIDNTE